ncbi:MAG: hybrid sensor histidine kinase/response regulator, partial [Candidatus Methylomirabilales bacterium]
QRTIAGTVDGLHDEMRRLRLTPVSTVLDLFPAMVRDLAAKQGKEIEWVAQGTDLEMDRRVLESMKDPLIHLVRNAIDHGIEPPEERAQAGKANRGHLAVTVAALEGGRIQIRVEDDGRGIDPARVRAAAVRARLITAEEAEALSEDAARDFIFRSGVSTSPIITDVSGHGLGLAIVKERVDRLEGQIRLETQVGVGTTVIMILPATIATFRGLLVYAGREPFLIPTEAVERVIRINPDAIARLEGHTVIHYKDQPLGIATLSHLLGLPEPDGESERPGAHPCVIVRSGEERAALLVEQILGDREVLVKELRPPLVRVQNVASAGLLGTGEVVLILRPADLLRAIREAPSPQAPPAPPEQADRQKVILVVDDSITTRQMERNILEAAGYQVRVAVDGMDAWTALKSEKFDLVVSDVDMPRMDGFELTTRIRADKKLAEMPVVLVTALEAREDKERGVEVGATAYIIKSSFDQSNLLEIIRRFI